MMAPYDRKTPSIFPVPKALSKAIGSGKTPSLEPTKQALQKRMRVGQFYYCDKCNKGIYKPSLGFVIHGNIYTADPTCRGGLVGNNFPDVKPGDKIEVTDVTETVLCAECFHEALQQTLPVIDNPWVEQNHSGINLNDGYSDNDDIPF